MTWTPQQKVFYSTLNNSSKSFKFVRKKFEIKFKPAFHHQNQLKKYSIQLLNAIIANVGSKIPKR